MESHHESKSGLSVEQARAVAHRLLGRSIDAIESWRPDVGGDDSFGFRLRCDGAAMLLQIKKKPGKPVGVLFHRRIRQAGVPTPELIAFDGAAGPDGQACAIWEWVEGRPAEWRQGELWPYDEAEFGALLRRIHDLPAEPPFGFLGDDPAERTFSYTPDLPATSPTWSGFFRFEAAARRFRDKGWFSPREADALAAMPGRLARDLDRAEPRLLHMGDVMHSGNMILDPAAGRILAVVDYVESTVGDPRWELAWVDYYFRDYPFYPGAFDLARFRDGYGAVHDPDDPIGRFYFLAVLLFEKLLFFDPESPRGRWAIEAVRRLARRSDLL